MRMTGGLGGVLPEDWAGNQRYAASTGRGGLTSRTGYQPLPRLLPRCLDAAATLMRRHADGLTEWPLGLADPIDAPPPQRSTLVLPTDLLAAAWRQFRRWEKSAGARSVPWSGGNGHREPSVQAEQRPTADPPSRLNRVSSLSTSRPTTGASTRPKAVISPMY
jgi:hypothetical protein